MGIVATMLPNPMRAQRLRSVLRKRHEMLECETWPAVERACAEQPVHLVVLDLYADGTANFEAIRRIKGRYPTITLVAYIGVSNEIVRDVFDAGRSGLDGLVIADREDSPRALSALLDQAEARSIAGVLRRSLSSISPLVRDAILVAVTRAHERLSPGKLAAILNVSRRSLAEQLAKTGYPPPQRLITWGRLIVAGHMLQDRRRTADSVGHALDFPSASAFRNSCQRYLYATPSEIRNRGGAAYVLRTFLRQARQTDQRPRRAIPFHARAPRLAV
jgi:AraC-like DNA-binding protein